MPRGWRFELTNDVTSLADAWEQLAARSGNVFSSWTWAETWMNTLGPAGDHMVATVHDDAGELRVVVPLTLTTRAGIRVLRFIGHGPGDELGPVAAPGDEATALDCLHDIIRSSELRYDLFLAERMPAGSATRWRTATLLREELSPVILAPDGWEAYLKRQSSNFRSQVRSRERKLERESRLEYRLSNGEAQDIDLLFDLHRRRWADEETSFMSAESFHRRFAVAAAARGWLRLWIMELDGVPAAAWYGFRFGDVESYYQGGWDPARSRQSVGFVLLAHTIRSALEDGIAEYRLLRGDEDYKDRFATERRTRETFAVPRSFIGRAAVKAASAFIEHEALRRFTRAVLD